MLVLELFLHELYYDPHMVRKDKIDQTGCHMISHAARQMKIPSSSPRKNPTYYSSQFRGGDAQVSSINKRNKPQCLIRNISHLLVWIT